MSEAIYAIPGLMPPTPTHYDLRVVLPENGKVYLCIYCGAGTETVNYCLHAHGFGGGYIKDPSYSYPDTPEGQAWASQESSWPQFVTKTTTLPATATVLKVIKENKWAIPVTERDDVTTKTYWIMEIPAGILPPGDTILELSIDGEVRRYTLQRPEFGAYGVPDITKRYSSLISTDTTTEE